MNLWKATLAAVAATACLGTGAHAQNAPAPTDADRAQEQQEDSYVFVAMETNKGTMYLALNETKAPISVENFLAYAEEGYYNDTIFHRVMEDFMIQGGGFDTSFDKKPTKDPIKNEWKNGLKNTRGSIAMARLGRQPDSATSQFFINLTDNPFLDQPRDGAGYAVFGQIVKGLDVLDEIGSVSIHREGMHQHVPDDPIILERVAVLSSEQAEELELPTP